MAISKQEKHPGGRPPKFKTEAELKKAVDKYFNDCDNRTVTVIKYGKKIKLPNPRPYTMSGLALALGMDRVSLVNYGKKDEFFNTVREAKIKCQQFAEEHLFTPGVAQGVIFNLKNNHVGWKDESVVVDEKKLSLEDSKGKKMSLEQLQEHFKNLFAQKNAKNKAR